MFDEQCQELGAELCPNGNACIADICSQLPQCCSSGWTQGCVDLAMLLCGTQCNCTHSICAQGGALTPSCNPCAAAVCKSDDFCCMNGWDSICVDEVGAVCGIDCTPGT